MRRPDEWGKLQMFPTSFSFHTICLTINAEAGEVVGRCITMSEEQYELKGNERQQLITDIRNILKSSTLTFFIKSHRAQIYKIEDIRLQSLIVGDYGNGYNCSVKGYANIGVVKEDSDCLTTPMNLDLIIKIEGEHVECVKDNRVNINSKF